MKQSKKDCKSCAAAAILGKETDFQFSCETLYKMKLGNRNYSFFNITESLF